MREVADGWIGPLMSKEGKYIILIVDPDSGSRARLKQVALSLAEVRKAYSCGTIREGLDRAASQKDIDVAIVSERFGEERMLEFIEEAKKTDAGSGWAFMVLLKSAAQSEEMIAGGLMHGIDGFLSEPYSADNMRQMTDIAAAVKLRTSKGRKRVAVEMLLKQVSAHLDAVAFYTSKGMAAEGALKKLREAAVSLRAFKPDHEMYIEAAVQVFSSATPPKATSYRGPSERVKENLETETLKKLEEKYRS